jgi:hypothetical protein
MHGLLQLEQSDVDVSLHRDIAPFSAGAEISVSAQPLEKPVLSDVDSVLRKDFRKFADET